MPELGDILFGFFTYILTWWITLFAVLPFQVGSSEPKPVGSDPGAPDRPRLGRKVLINSLVAFGLWLVGGGVWLIWGKTIMDQIGYS